MFSKGYFRAQINVAADSIEVQCTKYEQDWYKLEKKKGQDSENATRVKKIGKDGGPREMPRMKLT